MLSPLRLRRPWPASAGFCLLLVIAFGLGFALLRAWAMLGPVAWRPLFLLHCVLMAALPWLLLDRAGRQACGLQRPERWRWLLPALLLGPAFALALMGLGWSLYGNSTDHWFVSVAGSFRAQPTPGFAIWQLHLMFTLPAILFSPVGEEIFFRGLLQRALENRLRPPAATAVEASWFGAVHLVHHGIVLGAAGWSFRPVSGAIWFLAMVALSWLFASLRRRSGSVLPAIAAHAAFNATMNACIFAWLW